MAAHIKEYYLDMYIMALYDKDDNLCGVVDNARQLAEFVGITLDTARSTITRAYKKQRHGVLVNGKHCKIYFIEMGKDNDQ